MLDHLLWDQVRLKAALPYSNWHHTVLVSLAFDIGFDRVTLHSCHERTDVRLARRALWIMLPDTEVWTVQRNAGLTIAGNYSSTSPVQRITYSSPHIRLIVRITVYWRLFRGLSRAAGRSHRATPAQNLDQSRHGSLQIVRQYLPVQLIMSKTHRGCSHSSHLRSDRARRTRSTLESGSRGRDHCT